MKEWIIPVIVALIEAVRDITKIMMYTGRRKKGVKAGKRMFNRQTDRDALEKAAAQIGADPSALARLIEFESGWDPAAKNAASSARGLIQFIDSTARDLGYADADSLVAQNPTVQEQLLGPVVDYLRPFGPFGSDQELFMSVFYPAARSWPLDREFPADVQAANPRIKTVRDYMNKVYKIPDPWPAVMLLLTVGGLVLFQLIRR